MISPLLANVYLNDLDRTGEATCADLGQLVRYADDFVILCRTRRQAERALAHAIDRYVHRRLLRLMAHKGGQRRWRPDGHLFRSDDWPHLRFVREHGLFKLPGTIRYPGAAHAT